MNNFYGQGYNQQYQQPVMTVEETLNILQNLILKSDMNMMSPNEVLREIQLLAQQGRINIVGKGTNRVAVEVNGDISPYLSFRAPAIIKVPYSVDKAIDDNNREKLLYQSLKVIYQKTPRQDLQELINTLPQICEVRGFPSLVAQEKVEAIERSALIKNKGGEVASESIDLLMGPYKAQCVRLNELMDRYTFSADICPIITPFQYGFKLVNGQRVLTLLDTGYTLPKFPELGQILKEANVVPRRLIIFGKDIDVVKSANLSPDGKTQYNLITNIPNTNQGFVGLIQSILTRNGIYISEVISTSMAHSELVRSDVEYFKEVYDVAKNYARYYPDSNMGYYFGLVKANKMGMYR